MAISHVSAKWFHQHLLAWFAEQGRHELPWKKNHNVYHIWLSEIMLQQTQVATVIPYFERFIQAFPTIEQLAKSPLDSVLHYWSGLGYYARARNLHKTAQIISQDFSGKFPENQAALESLPGIGRSTAGAILAQAFHQHAAILDGNVKRVLCRFHCISKHPYEKATEQQLWDIATFYTPKQNVADYTQAIMDLGATCCTRSQPLCQQCPLQSRCLAFRQNAQALYPIKKIRKSIPTRYTRMLLIKNHIGDILLEQRPLNGIWAGLWSLPEFQTQNDIDQFLNKKLKFKHYASNTLAPFRHTFTHFHLHIEATLITLPYTKSIRTLVAPLAWVNTKGLAERGLPAPIKKLVQSALR